MKEDKLFSVFKNPLAFGEIVEPGFVEELRRGKRDTARESG